MPEYLTPKKGKSKKKFPELPFPGVKTFSKPLNPRKSAPNFGNGKKK